MQKKHYPIEEQIQDCYRYIGRPIPNLDNVTEDELFAHEAFLSKYFDWVEHPDFIQSVPMYRASGKVLVNGNEKYHKTIKEP